MCEQETQTVLDDPSRYFQEENHDLKLQILRLEEQIKLLERKNASDFSLASEKIATFENHINLLEDENFKLLDSLKAAK